MADDSDFKPPRLAWVLVASFLNKSDVPQARLVCSDSAAGIDSSSSAHRHFKVSASMWWGLWNHDLVRLSNSVSQIEADVGSAWDWEQLLRYMRKLPRVGTLECLSSTVVHFSWPPALHRGLWLTGYPNLRVLRFCGQVTSLIQLSQLAPGLESFACEELLLQPSPDQEGSPARDDDDSSSSSRDYGSLRKCKYLEIGCIQVPQDLPGTEAVAAALAAAFPSLRALPSIPYETIGLPFRNSHAHATDYVLDFGKLLHASTGLQALRVQPKYASCEAPACPSNYCSGVSFDFLAKQVAQLPALQCLSVQSLQLIGPVDLITTLTQLTALSLNIETFNGLKPNNMLDINAVLQRLGSLPKLRQLALPAELLCGACRPGVFQQLKHLLGSTHLVAVRAGNSGDANASCSHNLKKEFQHFKGLQQLVFFYSSGHRTGSQEERRVVHARDCSRLCRLHEASPSSFTGLVQQLEAAVPAELNRLYQLSTTAPGLQHVPSNAASRGQQQQQQQRGWHHRLEMVVAEVNRGASGSAGAWGPLGPAQWFA